MSSLQTESERQTNTSHQSPKITRIIIPAQLDLQMPVDSDVRLVNTSISQRFGDEPSTIDTTEPQIGRPADSAINPNIDEHYSAQDDDTHLFNKSTMMRGFTTNSWINNSVGIQGGLAIKDEQLRDNDNIRDDMAVGMGVLFAF